MSIYKECDIRGVYEKELHETEAIGIGKAIGTILNGGSVVVGGDTRYSTASLKTALIVGLTSAGCTVTDIGTVPTPVFYFAKSHLNAQGGVMVTASHNPAAYNGFKLSLGDQPVEPKDIQAIEDLVKTQRFITGNGNYIRTSVLETYRAHIRSLIPSGRSLNIVVDCGNGAASEIGPTILRDLGHEVHCLYCTFEDDFPNRNPNPSNEEHLAKLKAEVLQRKADLGVAFDGDGDRVVFVDDAGRYSEGETSFVLLLKYYLGSQRDLIGKEPVHVVYDGKSASIIDRTIREHGDIPVRERSGHAFIKKRFIETQAVLAGEVSGHFFFRELGHDDGIYAAVKMAEILGKQDKPFSAIIDMIDRPLITPDIRITMKPEAVTDILAHVGEVGKAHTISTLDGVRIDYPYGWIMVRKSVTEPCITVRLEADTVEHAETISNELFDGPYENIHKTVMDSLGRSLGPG